MVPLKRYVLVTGGNKGIGYAICEKLLEKHPDIHVLLGSRDRSRGEMAVSNLLSSIPSAKGRLELIEVDVASDESVESATKQLLGNDKLYGIINNAAIGHGYSAEETMNVNYFGTKRVCEAFSPYLKRPGGRIVNISSGAAPLYISECRDPDLKKALSRPHTLSLDELNEKAINLSKKDLQDCYGMSKAFVNAYTVLYAKDNPDLIINSCTPGFILTDMSRDFGATDSPEKGTICPLYLLLSLELEKLPTGRYYGSDTKRSPLDRYRAPGSPPYDGP